jgi:hypothetical protein
LVVTATPKAPVEASRATMDQVMAHGFRSRSAHTNQLAARSGKTVGVKTIEDR